MEIQTFITFRKLNNSFHFPNGSHDPNAVFMTVLMRSVFVSFLL